MTFNHVAQGHFMRYGAVGHVPGSLRDQIRTTNPKHFEIPCCFIGFSFRPNTTTGEKNLRILLQ